MRENVSRKCVTAVGKIPSKTKNQGSNTKSPVIVIVSVFEKLVHDGQNLHLG